MNFDHLKTDDFFNFSEFEKIANDQAENYEKAHPFAHIVLDGLFNAKLLDNLIQEFPRLDSEIWHKTNNPEIQIKLRSDWKSESDISPSALIAEQILNSGRFMKSLSKLTGIDGLIPDYYYTGGGLNQILRGGQLALHVDGTWHDYMKVHRRLNVIVFLNRDWKEEWGGDFELWNEDMTKCEKKVSPVFNRIVIFTTTDYTYHGHPDPLECPEDNSRKSLILYYYTSTRPDSEVKSKDAPHRALFTKKSDLPGFKK